MKMRYILLIALTISALTPFNVNAQFSDTDVGGIELTSEPLNPGPNQSVTIRLSSYSTDINRADVTWSVNGKEVTKGKGIKMFTFTTGDLGTKSLVEALIITQDGLSALKSLTFYPASVELLVEPESYTPPFYRGKAYFPYQGQARIIAIPSFVDEEGKQIPPSNLVFDWKEKDRKLTDQSGVGRDTLEYKAGIPIRTGEISVEVSSLNQKYLAEKNISIEPREATAVLYEENPEYGVLYNRALNESIKLEKGEIAIFAVPYYFNIYDPNDSSLKYDWNLNGNSIKTSGNGIILKKPTSGGGQANLSLQLSNTVDIFQFASLSLNINFGTVRTGLFGI